MPSLLLRGMNFVLHCLQFMAAAAIIEVDGLDVIIPTEFDFGFLRRYPVTYVTITNQSVPGFASISLGQVRDSFVVYDGYDLRDRDRVGTRSWNHSNLNIPTSVRVSLNVPDEYRPTGLIGGSFNSSFGRIVGSYILTPLTNRTGQLIVRPLDPRSYAYNGEIFYTSYRIGQYTNRPVISAAFRIISPAEYSEGSRIFHAPVGLESFVDCTLETQNRYVIVPEATFDQFLDELDRLGVVHEYDGETDSLMIRNITDDVISSLPVIQSLVLSDEGLQVSIQLLSPRDYLLPLTTDPSIRFVLINTGDTQCDLPPGLINRMFIHMDVSHGRIGFGEPLNAF